jgi:HEAT repeat protein
LAAALAALRDDGATARTLARLDGADAALRESLVLTLGVLGDATAVDEVRRRLSDDDAAVRTQAAHALGRIARAVRSREPDARVEGVVQLVALAARARTANEQKAATWALAQLDRPEAYAQLRRLAETDPRDDVRRHARRYLEKPRVSLILR